VRQACFLLLGLALSASLSAGQTVLFDDFEQGVQGDIWKKWPEATETLQTDASVNHTPDGTKSARAVEADPHGYASYADFGATPGMVRAETWIYDEFQDDGTVFARPVSIMLALVGAAPDPVQYTDYLQLGVVSWYSGGFSREYMIRTKYNDDNHLGYIPTGVFRKQGWTKLAIEADAHRNGGAVRFYIDGQLVGTSKRACRADLQYVRLGVNFKSYDNIWYDDVLVQVDPIPPCYEPRFDADGDEDVDQEDFSFFQLCFGGAGCNACRCMNSNGDGIVDVGDLAAFEACAGGPTVPAAAACDDGLPPP
jgi:hypothetical protein